MVHSNRATGFNEGITSEDVAELRETNKEWWRTPGLAMQGAIAIPRPETKGGPWAPGTQKEYSYSHSYGRMSPSSYTEMQPLPTLPRLAGMESGNSISQPPSPFTLQSPASASHLRKPESTVCALMQFYKVAEWGSKVQGAYEGATQKTNIQTGAGEKKRKVTLCSCSTWDTFLRLKLRREICDGN